MEGAPLNLDPRVVGQALAEVPGVASVHDLHLWSIRVDETLLTAHLVVHNLAAWEQVMEASHGLLNARFGIHHATLQPEPMTRRVRWGPRPGHGHEHDEPNGEGSKFNF